MVSWEPPPDRRELDALYREHDRMMDEHRASMADREAQGSPVGETTSTGLIYKDFAGNVQASAAAAEEPSAFDELQKDTLATVIAELRAEWQTDIDNLERRLANLITRMAFPGERAEETSYELKNRFVRMEGRIRQEQLDRGKFERTLANLVAENIEMKSLIGNLLKKLDAPKIRKRR